MKGGGLNKVNLFFQSMRGKSKSSHDLLDDERLSTVPAIENRKRALEGDVDDDDDDDEDDDEGDDEEVSYDNSGISN